MATGKYAKIINQLPRILGAEPEYQQKVEAVKQAMVAEKEEETVVNASIHTLREKLGIPSDAEIDIHWTDNGWHHIKIGLLSLFSLVWTVKRPAFERHASALAKQYIAIRIEKAKAEEIVSEINLRLEAVSQLLFDQYEVEGVETMKVDGRPVAARLVPYSVVQDKEAFRQWCLADPDLARLMTLPWMTVDKISKDRLVAGEEPPPGVTVYAKQRFTLGSE